MFDVRGVKEIAEAMELAELVRFLDEDREGYTEFILYGSRKQEG